MTTTLADRPAMESSDVSALLSRLAELEDVSEEFITIVLSILPHSRLLDTHNSQLFIDLSDKAVDHLRKSAGNFRKYLLGLRKICGSRGILPSSHVLSQELAKLGDGPVARGGFADVWQGTYENRHTAIKIIRTYEDMNREVLIKSFYKEAVIWKLLSHPNIVPFLGISDAFTPLCCMVSEWMPYGDMTGYIKVHLDANRPQIFVDICKGLRYLHSLDIVHRDLKGQNILINSNREACLGDFGFTTVISSLSTANASTTSSNAHGTYRWMAPELLVQETENDHRSGSAHSTASDIYALAMVAIELFSGKVPFHEFAVPAVIIKVTKEERPGRPQQTLQLGLCDDVWNLVKLCWQHEREKRPDIASVLNRLRAIAPQISLLERLVDFDLSSESSIDILRSLLEIPTDEVLPADSKSTGNLKFVEVLDQAMGSKYVDITLRQKCISTLATVYGGMGLLPESYLVSGDLKKKHDEPLVLGTYADIWEGTCDGQTVAIKIFRTSRSRKDEAIRKRIFEQAVTWKRLSHSNIVSFCGISNTSPPCIVSEWMMYGQLMEYLLLDPDADRLLLMIDIGNGLGFLHSRGFVHGDLKAAHILVNGEKQACLTGFQPEFTIDSTVPSRFTSGSHESWRWMAPELLFPEITGMPNNKPSPASDVYAFGMVSIEMFTGKAPFHELDNDAAVITRVLRGIQPQKPKEGSLFGLTEDVWELIEACWMVKSKERPSISSLLDRLENLVADRDPLKRIVNICPRFRILVIGQSGAGKSLLINSALEVTEATVSELISPKTDINKEIFPVDDKPFVLHDSQGFEHADVQNVKTVLRFIEERTRMPEIKDKLHAIWLCSGIQHRGGHISKTGVKEVLLLKNAGKLGHMPVIAVFTKYDRLISYVRSRHNGMSDNTISELVKRDVDVFLQEQYIRPFQSMAKEIPYIIVSTKSGYENTLSDLIKLTFDKVLEHVTKEVSSQQLPRRSLHQI